MLNNIGLPGLLLIAVVVLVLFGRGKISSLMGEVGKGITSFKKGIKDGSDEYDAAAEEERRETATRETPREVTRDVPGQTARDVTPREVTPHTTDRS